MKKPFFGVQLLGRCLNIHCKYVTEYNDYSRNRVAVTKFEESVKCCNRHPEVSVKSDKSF